MNFKEVFIFTFLFCTIINSDILSTEHDHWPTKSWQSKNPSELKMDSLMLLELDSVLQERYTYVNSYIIARHGYIVYEKFQNGYSAEQTSLVASCTKSLTNVILGILIDERYVNSIDDTVLNYLPEYDSINSDPRIRQLTFRHLSTFTSGLNHSERNGWEQGDIIENYLSVPFRSDPGIRFNYETPASHVISAVVNRTTGMNAYDFAREKFLDPIGFRNFSWDMVDGINTGGWGSYMRIKDMLRLGYLYLNRGIWDGDTLVDPAWVDSSTVKITSGGSPHNAGYGRNWWVDRAGDNEYYFAGGYGGQFIIIIPEFDMVIASQCNLDEHRETPRYLVHRYIIPAILDKPETPDVLTEPEEVQLISLYPNPAEEFITIRFNYNINENTRLYLITMNGKKLVDITIPKGDTKLFNLQLPDDIPSGFYLLTLSNSRQSFHKKVVIH